MPAYTRPAHITNRTARHPPLDPRLPRRDVPHLQLFAAARTPRGHPGDARQRRRHRTAAGRAVRDADAAAATKPADGAECDAIRLAGASLLGWSCLLFDTMCISVHLYMRSRCLFCCINVFSSLLLLSFASSSRCSQSACIQDSSKYYSVGDRRHILDKLTANQLIVS